MYFSNYMTVYVNVNHEILIVYINFSSRLLHNKNIIYDNYKHITIYLELY